MASVVHVITGPMVSSFMLRLAARVFSLSSRPAPKWKARVRLVQLVSHQQHECQIVQLQLAVITVDHHNKAYRVRV